MVDFRYHVVSIVAVFLALAIGIVVGSTALEQALIDDLRSRVNGLSEEKQQLNNEKDELQADEKSAASFVNGVAGALVAGRLSGHRVVVISLPGVDKEQRDQLAAMLTRAGALVSGRVRLTERLGDPTAAAEIDDLVVRLVPAGVSLPTGGAVVRATAELAAVLTRESSDALPSGTPAATTSVVSGFREAGLIALDGAMPLPADLAVVLLPVPPTPRPTPSPGSGPVPGLALLDALSSRASVVLAGCPDDGAVAGSLMAALRDDSRLAARVASVDGIDRAQGRVTAVLALTEALNGATGHYGSGPGTSGPVPTRRPTEP